MRLRNSSITASSCACRRGRRTESRAAASKRRLPSSHCWRTASRTGTGRRMLARWLEEVSSKGTASGASVGAARLGKERLELGKDPITELEARTCERERDVRMQTLEASGIGTRSADARIQLRPK